MNEMGSNIDVISKTVKQESIMSPKRKGNTKLPK